MKGGGTGPPGSTPDTEYHKATTDSEISLFKFSSSYHWKAV